ncbi:MAG: hypothetical protein M1324_00205 [Patescibacteria group bacterium]|nr:hypothetical protein [Patescibacteria group bacterium]
MAVVSVPREITLPDGSLNGSGIKIAHDTISEYLSPQSFNAFNLPEIIACTIDGVNYRYHRPENIFYLPEMLSNSEEDTTAGVDFTTAGKRLRLLFQEKDGSIVFRTIEHSPHPNLKCQ